jgi:hypothetical protein
MLPEYGTCSGNLSTQGRREKSGTDGSVHEAAVGC